jgi:hypothetical protein
MGFTADTKRTGFYKELTVEKRDELLSLTRAKFLPMIDNIYYSVYIRGDVKTAVNREQAECRVNMDEFLKTLYELKNTAVITQKTQSYRHGLQLTAGGIKNFAYCLTEPDLYDIFISSGLMNDKTPRIQVQIRSMGLWIYGIDKMVKDSYNTAASVLSDYGMVIDRVMESRIDYCYNTNYVKNFNEIFSDGYIETHGHSNLDQGGDFFRASSKGMVGLDISKNYFHMGSRKSKNVFFRAYHKGIEVVELGYKGYFFKIWHENGLISTYDRYCLEYAYTQAGGTGKGNYEHIHKARLMFYLEYGNDEARKSKYTTALNDINTTLRHFKELVDEYMPDVTTVINLEYQTKRKFYKYTDDYMDELRTAERERMPEQLERLYKVIDNRALWLNYLTKETFSLRKQVQDNPDGLPIYTDMWYRLRACKLGGVKKADYRWLRDYTQWLDEEVIKERFVSTVGSYAVHNGSLESGFLEDFAAAVTGLNDNHKAGEKKRLSVTVTGEDGEVIDSLHGTHLSFYKVKKEVKNKTVKNRRRRIIEASVADGRDGGGTHGESATELVTESVTEKAVDIRQKISDYKYGLDEEEKKENQYKIHNAIRKKAWDMGYGKGYAEGLAYGVTRSRFDEETAERYLKRQK